jgi:hypothetical protein
MLFLDTYNVYDNDLSIQLTMVGNNYVTTDQLLL